MKALKSKRRILSLFVTAVVALTMVFGGSVSVFATDSAKAGDLLWSYKDASVTGWTYMSSPAVDGEYVYAALASKLYRLDAKSGEAKGTVDLTSSNGNNNFAPTVASTKAGKKILVNLNGAVLNIIDADTMKVEKSVTYAEGQTSHQGLTPAVYSASDNSVYVGSWKSGQSGTYAKISLDDYSVKEIATNAKGFYWSGACVNNNYIVFGSTANGSGNTPSDGDAILYVYNKTTGVVNETVINDSGSVCSTVVEYNGKYYFTSKGGYLFEAVIGVDGKATVSKIATLAASSICTPWIDAGKAYIGSNKNVQVIDLASGTVEATYSAPGVTVAAVVTDGDAVYSTYNGTPGGLYDAKAGKDFFTPPQKEMENYCDSMIAIGDDGTLYYTNDSNNLFAVKGIDRPTLDDEGKNDPITPDDTEKTSSADVHVTIADKGKLVLTQEEVEVTDVDKDGALTINDALYAAHEEYYKGGAAAGYASANGQWGLSITKLWGDTNGSFGYWVNNVSANGLADPVKDGDYINAFIYKDGTYWSDTYCWFDKNTINAKIGEKITLTLSAAGYDANWNPVTSSVSGAAITINGEATDYSTDENGKVTIKFDKEGAYVISAVSESQTLVPPVCKVKVADDANVNASGGTAKTGDDFNAVIFGIVALVALAAATIVVRKRRA